MGWRHSFDPRHRVDVDRREQQAGGHRRRGLLQPRVLEGDRLRRSHRPRVARHWEIKEESLLRLRAPTCLGLPTHGALSQFGLFVWVLLHVYMYLCMHSATVHTFLVSYSSRVVAVLTSRKWSA